jgi:hypothetical protein
VSSIRKIRGQVKQSAVRKLHYGLLQGLINDIAKKEIFFAK